MILAIRDIAIVLAAITAIAVAAFPASGADTELRVEATVVAPEVVEIGDGQFCFYAPDAQQPWTGNIYPPCPDDISPETLNEISPASGDPVTINVE